MRDLLIQAVVLMVAVVGLAGPVSAQVRRLNVSKTTPISSVTASGIAAPVKCDSEGNIGFRAVQDSLEAAPVTVVSPDGHKVVAFKMPIDEKFQDFRFIDFALSNGGLYALARDNRGQSWILRYDRDGQFKDAVEPDLPMEAMQIETRGSGELLLAGTRSSKDNKKESERFIGIFSSNGHFLRRLSARNDVSAAKQASATPGEVGHDFGDKALRASVLQAGSDGTVYLMRRTATGPVFVISPAGLVRRVELTPPPGTINGGKLAIGSGQFAVEFLKYKGTAESGELESVILQIFDSFTGQVVRTASHSDPNVGAALACYNGDGFVFINTDDSSRLQLVQVTVE